MQMKKEKCRLQHSSLYSLCETNLDDAHVRFLMHSPKKMIAFYSWWIRQIVLDSTMQAWKSIISLPLWFRVRNIFASQIWLALHFIRVSKKIWRLPFNFLKFVLLLVTFAQNFWSRQNFKRWPLDLILTWCCLICWCVRAVKALFICTDLNSSQKNGHCLSVCHWICSGFCS